MMVKTCSLEYLEKKIDKWQKEIINNFTNLIVVEG
jgi:hypothetical protein